VTLPVFAAERRRLLSIDILCPRGAQQQTSRTPLLLSNEVADALADLGFLEGVTLGTRASEASEH